MLTAVTPPGGRSDFRSAAATAQAVAGHKIIFVRQPNTRVFNGSVTTGINSTYLLIDVDSERPVMAVVVHELLHRMRSMRPDLYEKFKDRLEPVLRNTAAHSDMSGCGWSTST